MLISSLAVGYNFISQSSKNNKSLSDYTQIESQLTDLQLRMIKLKNENKTLIEA